jgi:sugar phosphate isomerase/epimerase
MKDIKPRRKEKTGFPMIDMGHETCRLGAGVVPVAGIVGALLGAGYGGDFAVEHEPEDFDPTEDCRASLVFLRGLLGQPSALR